MSVNIAQAVSAYARAANGAAKAAPAEGVDAGGSGGGFGAVLERVVRDTVDASRNAEAMSVKAVANQAELNDVVTAVANAEATLQTVVAVRDRVIQAYQEIIRMPI